MLLARTALFFTNVGSGGGAPLVRVAGNRLTGWEAAVTRGTEELLEWLVVVANFLDCTRLLTLACHGLAERLCSGTRSALGYVDTGGTRLELSATGGGGGRDGGGGGRDGGGAVGVGPAVRPHHHPGTVVPIGMYTYAEACHYGLSTIRSQQRRTGPLIPAAPFFRVVLAAARKARHTHAAVEVWEAHAMAVLRAAFESQYIMLMKRAVANAAHAGRTYLEEKDVVLARAAV
jgi:histone H3/H4